MYKKIYLVVQLVIYSMYLPNHCQGLRSALYAIAHILMASGLAMFAVSFMLSLTKSKMQQ